MIYRAFLKYNYWFLLMEAYIILFSVYVVYVKAVAATERFVCDGQIL